MSSTVINNHHENPVRSTSDRLWNCQTWFCFGFLRGFFHFGCQKVREGCRERGSWRSQQQNGNRNTAICINKVRACAHTHTLYQTHTSGAACAISYSLSQGTIVFMPVAVWTSMFGIFIAECHTCFFVFKAFLCSYVSLSHPSNWLVLLFCFP